MVNSPHSTITGAITRAPLALSTVRAASEAADSVLPCTTVHHVTSALGVIAFALPVLPEDAVLVVSPVCGANVVVELWATDIVALAVVEVLACQHFTATVGFLVEGDRVSLGHAHGGKGEESCEGGKLHLGGG